MFPQLKKPNSESGVVLFIVLMTAIVIMIFSVGILTESINEINYAQQQIDQITSDQMAKGIFWNAYTSNSGMINSSTLNFTIYQNEDGSNGGVGRNYQITLNAGVTIGGITSYKVIANYDTL